MCSSCNLRAFPYRSFSVTEIINDPSLSDAISGMQIISTSSLKAGDPIAHFLLAFCISPDKFNAAFAPYVPIVKNRQGAKAIADMHTRGDDLSGKLKGKNGQLYKGDFFKILKSIQFTPEEAQHNSCNIAFAK